MVILSQKYNFPLVFIVTRLILITKINSHWWWNQRWTSRNQKLSASHIRWQLLLWEKFGSKTWA